MDDEVLLIDLMEKTHFVVLPALFNEFLATSTHILLVDKWSCSITYIQGIK